MSTRTRSGAAPRMRVTHGTDGSTQGRTCPECGEKLSAYNPGPACYAHTIGVPWKGPNTRT